jgi:uncharacterized membrane protein
VRTAQRIILGTGLLLVLATGLYVPWRATLVDRHSRRVTRPAGYGWIWHTPEIPYAVFHDYLEEGTVDANRMRRANSLFELEVDSSRILIQWVLIALVTGAAVALTRRPGSTD